MIWATLLSFGKSILEFLAKVPWKVWLFLGLILAAYLYGEARYSAGKAAMQVEWDEATAIQAKADAGLKDQQFKVTERVVTEYVDRVKVIREKGDTIVREVPVYVPSDACPLPPGYRVYHDAAAEGEVPDPAAVADAAPVAAQDAARTVADNYLTCRLNAATLTGLQDWVRQQQKLSEEAQ